MRTDPKPDDAWWDPKESEWVHGAKDAEGRLVGEVRYWNADNVLISTADHVDGKPHGVARRYFPDGQIAQDSRYVDGVIDGVRSFFRPQGDFEEPGLIANAPDNVVRCACIYERGDLIGTLYFDANDREVSERGRPMKKRPANVPATAWYLDGQGWFWSRSRGEAGEQRIESREYFDNGALRQVSSYVDGSERIYYKNGQLRSEGVRNRTGGSHFRRGIWRYYDPKGRIRRVTEYNDTGYEIRREWHRPVREAKKQGVLREGAVADTGAGDGFEVGVWIVRDAKGAAIAEYDLGPRVSDAELFAHEAATAEVAPELEGHGIYATLARARHAGREGDMELFGLLQPPAWHAIDDTGKPMSLAKHGHYTAKVVSRIHALRWGPPEPELLADLAAELFRADHAHAALDLIDAARLFGDDPRWMTARIAYLRGLDRGEEADRLASRSTKLDDRALELLAEIREHPDDNAPRLVFADHVANIFPEHTALIVAQCSGKPDRDLLRRLHATLPKWLREYAFQPERGFFPYLMYVSAEEFVNDDPDQLYRLSPTTNHLDLSYASGFIAQLVTMPALRRYIGLSFTDTYLHKTQTEQLARCPYFEQLDSLGLYATSLDNEDLRPILRATAFPRLASLDLNNGRSEQEYNLEGLREIVDAVYVPTLIELRVSKRWMGDGLIDDVVAKLPALVSVDLTSNSITDAGLTALAQIDRRFTALHLEGNDFTPAGLRALLSSEAVAEVFWLDVQRNDVGEAGGIAIATSKHLRKLTHLTMESRHDAHVTAAVAEALATGPLAQTIESLDLSSTHIGARGAAALAAGNFPKLTNLRLAYTEIGNDGARAIARASWLPHVKWLEISNTQISDDAILTFCDADTHPELMLALGRITDPTTQKRLRDRFGQRARFVE